MSEESYQVKVYFTDGSLSERWEATVDDETHELTLWDPEGNELWKEEHLKQRNITRVLVQNSFIFETETGGTMKKFTVEISGEALRYITARSKLRVPAGRTRVTKND